ncbi:hypothetical protein JI739_14080 [Ramlibacter sp. AW1]|uniref:Uncharacterized protein n=1 Tax=Ramlibacter aurantiacus TaxID=2801330 RepID=A0A936ZIE5_9BURK|nr:hypothetical protein [Ramlibacter aurantiacus]MBL0421482.1 hypothetical protein [Ramlibacter aurantiacus]
MKSLSLPALSAVLLLSAMTLHSAAEAPPSAPAPQYPTWLEMKPGYAEACIKAGGCVPMTQAELHNLAVQVMQRTLQFCPRSQSI